MSELDRITSCAVHPAVGIARLGKSTTDFYLAPEVPGANADPGPGGFKDANGNTKREAARFRVYGYAADGSVVKELTSDDAEIVWRVHLANNKAAWYKFENALDLGAFAKPAGRRNAAVTDRRSLALDPGSRTLTGPRASATVDATAFGGTNWHLGDLVTDDKARLIVLGGHGASRSATGTPPQTFANNDGWIDDTSDGPVRATVTLRNSANTKLEARPAMVAVSPPNFGQGLRGVVTMYDVVVDLFVRKFQWKLPSEISYWRDIYPIFDRLCGLAGVNAGAFILFGGGSPSNLLEPELQSKLMDPSSASESLRAKIFRWFRVPHLAVRDAKAIPPIYGDLFGDFDREAGADLWVTPLQYARLERWSRGDFVVDPAHKPAPPPSIDAVALAERPHSLDRSHLENILGGPFHPGIELTWTMRLQSMWSGPFRLNILPEDVEARLDWGPTLTPEIALAPDGPFSASGPGTLTAFLGVPWQTDEASCDAGYEFGTFLPLPTFWAARVPNHVLPERAYERFMDTTLPVAQRFKHLNLRSPWLRFFSSQYRQRIGAMVAEWDDLGIVVARPSPPDAANFGLGERLYVETAVDGALKIDDATFAQVLIAEGATPAAAITAAGMAPPGAAPIAPSRRRTFHRGEV
jgi:hypothetical protein